jgi:hypothetical protein
MFTIGGRWLLLMPVAFSTLFILLPAISDLTGVLRCDCLVLLMMTVETIVVTLTDDVSIAVNDTVTTDAVFDDVIHCSAGI